MAEHRSGAVFAVHDKNLDDLLKELGLYDAIEGPGIRCEFCRRNVKRENLGFIYFIDDQPKVCCDDLACYQELLRRTNR
jgi:hypothetical protein